MKVKDLVKKLQKEDPDLLVVVARDEEGNGFSPLHEFTLEKYVADSKYSGEIGDAGDGQKGCKAVVLWPTN